MDPFNLSGGGKDSSADEWGFLAPGNGAVKEDQRLSKRGHGHILPNPVHGGVSITGASRMGWLSLSGLQRLRFGDVSAQAAQLARATLAALAIAGDRLAFDTPSLWLRSGCDLVRTSESLKFDRGDEREPFSVNADEAIACFHELRDRTAQAGIVMTSNTVTLAPAQGLADAIEYATSRASAVEADEKKG